MKKYLRDTKSCIANAYLKFVLGAIALFPASVLADLPTADTVADGAATDSPIQASRDLVTIGVTIIATLLAAAIVVGGAWQIYKAYAEAVRKGEWGGMAVTSIVGVVMIAGGVIMAVLAVEYGTFA